MQQPYLEINLNTSYYGPQYVKAIYEKQSGYKMEETKINGDLAYVYSYNAYPDTKTVYVIRGNWVYLLSTSRYDLDEVKRIIASFKFDRTAIPDPLPGWGTIRNEQVGVEFRYPENKTGNNTGMGYSENPAGLNPRYTLFSGAFAVDYNLSSEIVRYPNAAPIIKTGKIKVGNKIGDSYETSTGLVDIQVPLHGGILDIFYNKYSVARDSSQEAVNRAMTTFLFSEEKPIVTPIPPGYDSYSDGVLYENSTYKFKMSLPGIFRNKFNVVESVDENNYPLLTFYFTTQDPKYPQGFSGFQLHILPASKFTQGAFYYLGHVYQFSGSEIQSWMADYPKDINSQDIAGAVKSFRFIIN